MKFLLSLLLAASPFFVFSQSGRQEIPLKDAREIFVFGDLSGVHITTGGTNTIAVNHVLTVNGEDQQELRQLDIVREGRTIRILEKKPTAELIKDKFPGGGMNVAHGPEKKEWGDYGGKKVVAYLEIVVPAGVKVSAETVYGGLNARGVTEMPMAKSKYGVVEVVFAANASINGLDYESEYQSVDVTLPANTSGNLHLRTTFGNMFTDFDFPIKANMDQAGHDHGPKSQPIDAELNGGGKDITLRAKYQNIYLRKLE
ncbi:DUF4097 family beta strand repeat-containing protein [Neolewinella persica]|uniref:hypothetical protein n=1 Tax=Neolewinella persica TaxID=70998 RepID=UPI00036042AB|nr:hypothetical protein [Neolewinella persica]